MATRLYMPPSNIVPIRHHPAFRGKTKHKVLLRNNATGEERLIASDSEWEDVHEFLWTEGNLACDCNRHLEFERAGGREPGAREVGCGDERYTALYALLPDGRKVFLDGEPDAASA